MALHVAQFNLKARDVARTGAFWAAALGWEARAGGGVSVQPAGSGWPVPGLVSIDVIPVPDPGAVCDRGHLELATTSAAGHAALIDRLRQQGATLITGTVLADPEGTVFCVPEPRGQYRDTGPIGAFVVDCADPRALAGFWADALAWTVHEVTDERALLRAADGTGPYLEFARASHVDDAFNRVHLDLLPTPADAQAAEVARLRSLGATPHNLDDFPWKILTDPEGNEFCVLEGT